MVDNFIEDKDWSDEEIEGYLQFCEGFFEAMKDKIIIK